MCALESSLLRSVGTLGCRLLPATKAAAKTDFVAGRELGVLSGLVEFLGVIESFRGVCSSVWGAEASKVEVGWSFQTSV